MVVHKSTVQINLLYNQPYKAFNFAHVSFREIKASAFVHILISENINLYKTGIKEDKM